MIKKVEMFTVSSYLFKKIKWKMFSYVSVVCYIQRSNDAQSAEQHFHTWC